MILYMYIAPGQGLTTPWGRNFDVNRNILSLRSFVASFKKISLKSDFIQFFFTILYMYIAPGQGQTDKILMSTEMSCHFIHLLQVSKKCLWSLILYNFLHDLIHVYSPGAGADSPQGTKFWCQQEGLITLPICCKFQRNLFEVWFYTFFFHDLIHVYSPRAGAYSPTRGQSVDVNRNFLSLRSSVASFKS